jgi:hypothetical protein
MILILKVARRSCACGYHSFVVRLALRPPARLRGLVEMSTWRGHLPFGRRSFTLLLLRPHCFGWPSPDFPATSVLCAFSNARPSGQSWVLVSGIMSSSHLIGRLHKRHHPMFGSADVLHASIISTRFGGNSIGTQSSSTADSFVCMRSISGVWRSLFGRRTSHRKKDAGLSTPGTLRITSLAAELPSIIPQFDREDR